MDTVVTLVNWVIFNAYRSVTCHYFNFQASNVGHEAEENTIGTLSKIEAKDALRKHKGNIWAAVTECVEQRQLKVISQQLALRVFSQWIFPECTYPEHIFAKIHADAN